MMYLLIFAFVGGACLGLLTVSQRPATLVFCAIVCVLVAWRCIYFAATQPAVERAERIHYLELEESILEHSSCTSKRTGKFDPEKARTKQWRLAQTRAELAKLRALQRAEQP